MLKYMLGFGFIVTVIQSPLQGKAQPDIIEQEINKHLEQQPAPSPNQRASSTEVIHTLVVNKKESSLNNSSKTLGVQKRMSRTLGTVDGRRTRQGAFLGVSQVSGGQAIGAVQPKKTDKTKPIEKKLKDLYPFTQDATSTPTEEQERTNH